MQNQFTMADAVCRSSIAVQMTILYGTAYPFVYLRVTDARAAQQTPRPYESVLFKDLHPTNI